MSDIRYDPLHNEYVIIAPNRLYRPDCLYQESTAKDSLECPFCEGNEYLTPPEIYAIRDNRPNKKGWKSRVVPNLYRALEIESPWQNSDVGIYDNMAGFGAHEVIIDMPTHITRLDKWNKEHFYNWLMTLKFRIKDLKNDIRLIYFALFKNHGFQSGATQTHPHTQLIALPIVPKSRNIMCQRANKFYKEHGVNPFEAVITKELKDRDRVINESKNFVTIAPFASSFPFEMMIISKQNIVSIDEMDSSSIEELSIILQKLFISLYKELGDFHFNIHFYLPPVQKNYATEEYFDNIPHFWRFAIRIIPRLYKIGGFETATGVYINPIPPEDAANMIIKSWKSQL